MQLQLGLLPGLGLVIGQRKLLCSNTVLGTVRPVASTMEVCMNREKYDKHDGMENFPDPRLELRVVEPTEIPHRPVDDSAHVLAAACALANYEIEIGGRRPQRKGPPKPRELPVVWLPGPDFDPEALELLIKSGRIGRA
jgi:hypothetical protein